VARLVLTDASPLIGLAWVDGLDWLRTLFGTAWIPPEVKREALTGLGRPGEAAIAAALKNGTLREWRRPGAAASKLTLPDLDEGEAACIRIGHARVVRGDEVLLLIDERAGRAVAVEHGLRIAGTAAVIGMAKSAGLIPSAKAVFAMLHGSSFRISPEVIRTVLTRVGE
jgi:predicted nucleic acid-binding protein